MKIAHVALWCCDLERAVAFWERYFGAVARAPYASARRPGFVSRFVRLAGGAELELMSAPWLEEGVSPAVERPGWAHVAISMGSEAAVDALAASLSADGLLVAAPRHTGDGFYEAVAQDPEGNLVEITA